MATHKFAVGDRVRYIGNDRPEWLVHPEATITRLAASNGTYDVDVEFDVPWTKGIYSSDRGFGLQDFMLEPLTLLIDPDRPIVSNDRREFVVMGRFKHPTAGDCLVGDVGRTDNYPLFLSLTTGRVVPRYPNDQSASALRFSNKPVVTTHVDEIDGVMVQLTRTEGVPTKVEILP
jgi:hypothetical protein